MTQENSPSMMDTLRRGMPPRDRVNPRQVITHVRTVKALAERSVKQQQLLCEALARFQRLRVMAGEKIIADDPWKARSPDAKTIRRYMEHLAQCSLPWQDNSKAALRLYLQEIGRLDLAALVEIPHAPKPEVIRRGYFPRNF